MSRLSSRLRVRRAPALLADRRAVVTLEFGLVGSAFIGLILFILGAGLVLWAKGTIQMAASETARCTAIASLDCTDPQAYAASVIGKWGAGGILPPISVSVLSGATCNGTVGRFSMVTISTTMPGIWEIAPALSNAILSATACYPTAR